MIRLDTCPPIYLLENRPGRGSLVESRMRSVADTRFALSSLVRMECLHKPPRDGNVVSHAPSVPMPVRSSRLCMPSATLFCARRRPTPQCAAELPRVQQLGVTRAAVDLPMLVLDLARGAGRKVTEG